MMESFLAGAFAGLAVDLCLYPLDTIKTQLQRPPNVGLSIDCRSLPPPLCTCHGYYRGIGAVLIGSVPAAALFFAVHDGLLQAAPAGHPLVNAVLAAAAGETVACAVRVPVERMKQSRQVGVAARLLEGSPLSPGSVYRGLGAMLARELPFAILQYPLYGALRGRLPGLEGRLGDALAGSIAGGITAVLTTPLDVCKTRIMLRAQPQAAMHPGWFRVLGEIAREGALFAGVLPRTAWISLGGFVYFGAYEVGRAQLHQFQRPT